MIALVLAGLNALRYHLVTERTIAAWDRAELPPPRAPRRRCINRAVDARDPDGTNDLVHDVLESATRALQKLFRRAT
jgi:hypothetical protein